jgi:drug/metabolite transporter (DMT)-like permease
MQRGEGWSIYIQLGLISVMWGGAFLLIKVGVETIPPFLLSATRGLLAAAVLFVVLGASRRRTDGGEAVGWLPAIVLGTFSGWLPNVLTAWALTRIDSSLAAIIGAASPIATAVFVHYLLTHERLNRSQLGGVFVGLFGVAFIIGIDTISVSGQDVLGQLAMVGVAISYAFGAVYGRMLKPAQPARLTLRLQLVSGLVSLAVALAAEAPWDVRPSRASLLALVALAVFSSAIPFWIYLRLFSRARALVVAMIGYLIPAVAVVLGFVFLDERLGFAALGGMGLVLLGVYFTGRQSSAPGVQSSDPGFGA